jgi:small GTP-binding protein
MEEDCDIFKIVIVGTSGTGKTNIVTKYIRDEFNSSQKNTVGVEFLSKIVQVRSQKIKVAIWDTAESITLQIPKQSLLQRGQRCSTSLRCGPTPELPRHLSMAPASK